VLKHIDEQNPSGFRFELTAAEMNAGYVAFLTGPIEGTISLADNSAAYDVSDDVIPVLAEHVGQLHIAIIEEHHAAGRFLDVEVPDIEDVSL
jgi:hypothetical protein